MSYDILVAEDSATEAEELRGLQERAGCRVNVARSGEAALERVEEGALELLLSDVVTPGIGGYDLCRGVREIRPSTPSGCAVELGPASESTPRSSATPSRTMRRRSRSWTCSSREALLARPSPAQDS